jgi:fermentation-respiration switch protein FrsA (DUF1100 family)
VPIVRWRLVVVGLGIGVLVLAFVYVGVVALFQRRLLFPRPSVVGAPARPDDALQVWLPTAVGQVEAWYLAPLGGPPGPAPTLLFFHGNGELIDFCPEDFVEPRRWGVGALLVEFPGYGRSSGTPSQENIRRAVLAAFDWAQAQSNIDARRIIAHGRSLGGAAAAILAVERSPAALVLASTFTSIRSFAHQFWVPEFVVLDPFDTLSLLPAYAGPVLVLHGSRDEIVPLRHGRALAQAARGAELEVLSCGHNDCAVPWSRIRRFLAERGVLRD